MGLLQRALSCLQQSQSDEMPGIDFYTLAHDAGLKKCAVLVEIGGTYCIKQFYGLTAQTIMKSVSTSAFWDEVLDEGWQVKKGKDLAMFYQLFSEEDKNELNCLILKRFKIGGETNAIWIGCGDESVIHAADTIINEIMERGIDFPLGDDVIHTEIPAGFFANLYEIDFSDAVEALSGNSVNYSPELLFSLSRTIFYGAYHICKALFEHPNGCYVSRDTCLRAVIFSSCEIAASGFALQLSQALTPYFPPKVLEALQIYGIGTAETSASVISFLQTTN